MSELKERQKIILDNMIYSQRRMDILIITISGAGIYICLETLKYLSENHHENNLLIKISGATFLLGIIANFISQLSGYRTHKEDLLMHQVLIDSPNDKISEIDKKEAEKYNNLSKKYSNITSKLNYLSMSLMFAGIAIILMFFFISF